uniref:ANKLE2 third alpha/beta domain-containing protein n=1 Tax=Acrobeloides nanus TaxID=290746 RepID=A0A914CVM8_9BILA
MSKEVFKVTIPNSPDPFIFNDFKGVKEFLNSPKGKSPGVRFKKIKEDEIDKIDEIKLPNVPSTSTINEPVLPYKSLKAPRLNELKRAIEQKNNTKFDELLAENPYFIINMSGDTPTIIQSGCWYNAMHVASRCGNLHVVQKILDCITDLKWLENAYDTNASIEHRAQFLLEAFLNTPDKSENNTPLHYACKYGFADIVEVLLSHSVCSPDPKNKYNETPLDIICQAYKGESKSKIVEEIRQKFGQKFYVSLYRGTDNCIPARLVVTDQQQLFSRIPEESFKISTESPMNGRQRTPIRRLVVENLANLSLSPSSISTGSRSDSSSTPIRRLNEFYLSALAGPFMDSVSAEKLYQEWSTEAIDLGRRDPEKGYEVVGRRLARKHSVNFIEYFVFMGELVNLSTIKGLQLLEDYLQILYEKKTDSKRQFELSHDNLGDELAKLLRLEDRDNSAAHEEDEEDVFHDSRDTFYE